MPRPRKYKSDDERRIARLKQQQERRKHESGAKRSQRLFQDAFQHRQSRSSETETARSNRLHCDAFRHRKARAAESETQRSERQQNDAFQRHNARAAESETQKVERHQNDSAQKQSRRNTESPDSRNSRIKTRRISIHQGTVGHARRYDFQLFDENIILQQMPQHFCGNFKDSTCPHCHAFRWEGELKSLCCAQGKILLDVVPAPPTNLEKFYDINTFGNTFLKNIRAYNNLFALASLGCDEIKYGGFNPIFKIQGKLCHMIGSLLPNSDESPKSAQLYFHDSEKELQHRLAIRSLDEDIIKEVQTALHENNNYIKSFKAAIELNIDHNLEIVLHAQKHLKPQNAHCRRYNLPENSEVAAIIPGSPVGNLDIIVHCREGGLQRINQVHRSYDPLHYILLFPYGTDGWHVGLKRTNNRTLTQADFYSHRLQVRQNNFNIIMKSRRLMQQYAVDAYANIQLSRLQWAKNNQKTIRAEKYSGLFDAVADGDAINAGHKVILPPTIYGSPRFYKELFQNSMTVVRSMGKPDYFLTFTTNPKWKEIIEALNPGERSGDRPDLCARVFHLKYNSLMQDLLKKMVLGKVRAHSATIEWQKRGLTHAHILLIMEDDDKPRMIEAIDRVVCCEIPDKNKNPILHKIITSNNIHGPCGTANPYSPCMEGEGTYRHCSKGYPKPLHTCTIVGENSYPEYRRRSTEDGGFAYILKRKDSEFTVDNRWIVPYNPFLSLRYDAHINCEVVHSVQAVKYLYKYICKGNDQITFTVRDNRDNDVQVSDEIETFLNARYISASEAFWRIYEFPLHSRKPAVEKLPCHMPKEQLIFYEEGQEHSALSDGEPVTKLTGYFRVNQEDPGAHEILYPDMPKYFTWNKEQKKWQRRKCGLIDENHKFIAETLGRIPTISLSRHQSELYYLRMLLHHKAGAKSFDDLKTIEGQLCPTYQEACLKLGLLYEDTEKDKAMEEASSILFGSQLRELFCTILLYCMTTDTLAFWDRWKIKLAEDIMRQNHEAVMSERSVHTVLFKIQERLQHDGLDIHVNFGLPRLDPTNLEVTEIAQILKEETDFDCHQLQISVEQMLPTLNSEQNKVFQEVTKSACEGLGKIFCLNASGGTGKTYTINVILDYLRSQKKIALATALSGIAATLLHNGRTLHSRCKVPLTIKDESICSFTKRDAIGQLMQKADLLIIDEVTMGDRRVFECIDRSLQDVRTCKKPFGGLTVLFSGDWKQILPVVLHGSRSQIIEATLKKSYLWQQLITLDLTTNVRVTSAGTDTDFQDLLQHIGNGKFPTESDIGYHKIQLPNDLLLNSNKLSDLCDFVFENLEENSMDTCWLANRSVITPTNKAAEQVNVYMIGKFPGDERVYKSSDSVDNELHYPIEFINQLNPPGFPPHILKLKVGCTIMLLRNLDPCNGHTNGTRYIVKQLLNHIIEAVVATGSYASNVLLIPRIPHISQENEFPFEMKRKQFPIKLAFGITANKSQGQTLQRMGLYLPKNFFSHGQLYVALSRVGKRENLKILVINGNYDEKDGTFVDNFVYTEILH